MGLSEGFAAFDSIEFESDVELLTAELSRMDSKERLKKMKHASRRLAFCAGIEGTGHHLWHAIFSQCEAKSGRCNLNEDVGTALWNQGFKSELSGKPRTRPSGLLSLEQERFVWRSSGWEQRNVSTEKFARLKDSAVVRLKSALAEMVKPGLTFPFANKKGRTGMLSYPNFGGPLQIFQNPDVRLLAKIAEDSSADLRVIYLHRQAASVLRSRGHGYKNIFTAAVVLEHSARVLLAQLRGLDQAFVRCVEYERMPHLPAGFEDWLSPVVRDSRVNIAALARTTFNPSGQRKNTTKVGKRSDAGKPLATLGKNVPKVTARHKSARDPKSRAGTSSFSTSASMRDSERNDKISVFVVDFLQRALDEHTSRHVAGPEIL